MTKSEALARNKHIIEVVSGAVYRDSGECINVKCDGNAIAWPSWGFAVWDYELFTPDFSWELFKEGLLAVGCETDEEKDIFTKYLKIDCETWSGHERYEMVYYCDEMARIIIPFSSIPPELLKPAFEPRKPEMFTYEEWKALSPDECMACNELIRGEIEYDGNNEATNLEYCYGFDHKYVQTIYFNDIGRFQYRIKPKPEYEPYDKPEAWMINKVLQSKTNPDKCYSIIGMDKDKIEIIIHSYYHGITMPTAFDKYNLLLNPDTGETSPFGKQKGGV